MAVSDLGGADLRQIGEPRRPGKRPSIGNQAFIAGRWALTAGRINLMKPQTGATMMGEIEEACGRIEHLVESGYLPDSLKRDLELLLRAVKRGSAGDADDGPASIMKRAALIELADLVGTTQQTIGKIEKGLEHSSFSAIADVLGIDRRLLDRPALTTNDRPA